MSDRERWILYPIITLALCFALRSHWELQQLREVIVMERVSTASGVVGQRVHLIGNEVVLQSSTRSPPFAKCITTSNGDGALVLNGASGNALAHLGGDAGGGTLETFDRQQRKLVWITSASGDGAVVAVRPGDRKAMLLGHYEPLKASGLFEIEVGEQNARLVPRVGWVEVAAKKGTNLEEKPGGKGGRPASAPGKTPLDSGAVQGTGAVQGKSGEGAKP